MGVCLLDQTAILNKNKVIHTVLNLCSKEVY